MAVFFSTDVILLLPLQIEARSIDHVKKQAKGLEMKIIELQQKVDSKVRYRTVHSVTASVESWVVSREAR